MGNHQRGRVDPRSARSVSAKGAPLIFFLFVLSDESYRPAGLGGAGPSSIPSPLENNAGGGNPSTSILTTNGGTSPPPPLFPAISARTAPSRTVRAPSCTVRARPDTNRCLCVLCAILRRSSTIRHHLLVWSWSATSCAVRARPDTNCWCLAVLCAILHRSSTIRHQSVSGRGLRLPAPFEHDQTPIAGVCACSAPSCTVRARSDTNCWCLVVVCDFLSRSSTIRHQLLVSGRALRVPVPFENDQTPAIGVCACSAPSRTVRARPDTSLCVLCAFPHRRARPGTQDGCLVVLCAFLYRSSVYTVLGRRNI